MVNKKALIRGDNIRECPFGLPIPTACENAGNSVLRMMPVEDTQEPEKAKKTNRIVYAYHKQCKHCKFADKILKNHDKVDCDFNDSGEGMKSYPFAGSPLYPSVFHGMSADGLYGFPLGYYDDYGRSRNMFFGLFSLIGGKIHETIIKLAKMI